MVNDFSKLLEFQKQSLAHGTFSYWVDEGESHPTLKQPKICSFRPLPPGKVPSSRLSSHQTFIPPTKV